MSGNGNQPLASSQRGPGSYPRASTPHRPVECYHPSGSAGAAYMSNASGGSQGSTQPSLRVQPTPPQPSAPPAPQQDMSKSTMSGHNFVSPNPNGPRAQYANYQFRGQHGTRPSSHPRQQQPYIPAAATTAGPVMYPTLLFQPTPLSMQTYQQPQSGSARYYPYMGHHHYLGYNNQPSHTPPYYGYANTPQLPTPSMTASAGGGRNATTLVGPQGSPAAPAAQSTSLAQPAPHMHHSIPGKRPTVQKRIYRVPIIDPVTRQEVLTDLFTNDSSYVSTETTDRQTPQPEQQSHAHSIAEEFSRMVNEAANQPSYSSIKSFVHKSVALSVTSPSPDQPQTNAISSVSTINSNVLKSELVNINDITPDPDAAVEPGETPVVSAISDSPVIVPKLTVNVKPNQKSESTEQSVVIEAIKNVVTEQVDPSKPIKISASPAESVSTVMSTNTVPSSVAVESATMAASVMAPPRPQRPPRERIHRSEDKEKDQHKGTDTDNTKEIQNEKDQNNEKENETVKKQDKIKGQEKVTETEKVKENVKEVVADFTQERKILATIMNGPMSVEIGSVDSIPQATNPTTSQCNQHSSSEIIQKQAKDPSDPEYVSSEVAVTIAEPIAIKQTIQDQLTPTELLSASIEKFVKEKSHTEETSETKSSSAFEAQAKLTQSISSVCRTHNQPESKMKDINLDNQTTDQGDANGNAANETKIETVNEDINKNDKALKNSKNNSKKAAKMAAAENDSTVEEPEACENGDETDNIAVTKDIIVTDDIPADKITEGDLSEETPEPSTKSTQILAPTVFVPKYKYSNDQWSPLNKSGRKCYDIGLLKQIKDDPLSKNKPNNAPLLEACNVIRTTPMQEPITFAPILRSVNDSLFPPFAKGGGVGGSRSSIPQKKDPRNMPSNGRGSVKLNSPLPSSNSAQKQVIHVSLSLRDEVKLNESDSAWKPTRFRRDALSEEEQNTQELYKKFRGILNKLTPQKFDTLLDKVKTLEINNQKRLEGVIDLIFEKAIDEPNFSVAYAAMCNKLSMLKVPAEDAANPGKCVNFRALIINKCQQQFEANKTDQQVLKLEKDYAECTDPNKKKELLLMLQEENRRVRMRSVGNVRFIGELYKLKMLTLKIMDYCMKHLIEKLEEEKLECLCKLLTTIGEQIENEPNSQLDKIFKMMQDIVDHRKSNKISSRVKFMLQDVIELRRRRWVVKSVIDSQPKMMDQIQKEAEQQQRNIEWMNASPIGGSGGGGFRRDDGNRGKRGGDNRRQNAFMDNTWKTTPTRTTNFPVDTSKFKVVTQKSLNNIKLAPQVAWAQGSGTKTQVQSPSTNSLINLNKNKFSVLENSSTDPSTLRTSNRELTPPAYHSKGASIERSTFSPRGDFMSGGGNKSGSVGVSLSLSASRNPIEPSQPATPPPVADTPPSHSLPQEPLAGEKMQNNAKFSINQCLYNNSDVNELVTDIKKLFPPQYHAAFINEVLNVVLEKSPKEVELIAKALLHVVSTNTISAEHFLSGLKEVFEFGPDLYIDIPMLYDYFGKIVAPHIENKHITFVQCFNLSENIIAANQGHLLLKSILTTLNDSMGPTFVKSKWQESGLQLNKWMKEDQVPKWLEDNHLEFLRSGINTTEESKKILTPADTQSKLLQLMMRDENCECIKAWVHDYLGKASNEDWFMRALIQAIYEYALYGNESRDVPHFNQDRMSKYASLINEFGESKEAREASCLVGIQHLIHRLEHPQGLTLEIFQYLHEQYLISLDGFLSWEKSDKEPEGKGVMMMALTSFFTSIKEADNEDSCSED